jgi:sulfur-oxidizing protein SoxZ
MATPKPRIRAARTASKGEVIEIKTLISHLMESGQRKDHEGNVIPRKIINRFVCNYNGEEVFASDWHPSISSNPYLSFHLIATESGTLEFVWTDDDGSLYTADHEISVA